MLENLEQALAEVQKSDCKLQSVLSNKKETLKSEQKKEKELLKLKANDQKALEGKRTEIEKLQSGLANLQQQYEADVATQAAAQEHYQAVSSGLSAAEDGHSASLQEQLMGQFADLGKLITRDLQPRDCFVWMTFSCKEDCESGRFRYARS